MRNTIIYCNSQKVGTASEAQPSVLDIARVLGYTTSTLHISCDYRQTAWVELEKE